jgi:hypothetical protein
MTSSVDPTLEIVAIKTRLDALANKCYEGVDQGTELPVDGFSNKAAYRDLQPGSVIPTATQRMLAAGEQSQPHVWAFQVAHVASTRAEAVRLSIETDVTLIGWEPSTNASPITTFFFTVYDAMAKDGETVQWIATRFYETTLGQNPDL